MQKIPLVLSVAALGLSGYAAWKAGCPGSCASPAPAPEGPAAEVRSELASLASRLSALEVVPKPLGPAPSGPATASGPSLATGSPAARGTAPTPEAEIERRVAALEEKARALEPGKFQFARSAPAGALELDGDFELPPLITSTADAKKALDLTDGQKADFDRIVDDTKRELSDLKKIKDDEGKTWEDVEQAAFSGLRGDGGPIRLDFSKVSAFRGKTIPGRSETFGQAEDRIRNDSKKRMRDGLTKDQQSKFDNSIVDPLLGPGSSRTVVASFMTASPVEVKSGDK